MPVQIIMLKETRKTNWNYYNPRKKKCSKGATELVILSLAAMLKTHKNWSYYIPLKKIVNNIFSVHHIVVGYWIMT